MSILGVLLDYLRDVDPGPVYCTRTPDVTPADPWPAELVRLVRAGGPASAGSYADSGPTARFDSPVIAVSCWAADEPSADDLCDRVRRALYAAPGNGIPIGRVSDFAGPAYVADETAPMVDRYVFSVSIPMVLA